MVDGEGGKHNKIVALLGLGAAVFIAVTWLLPKFEKHPGYVLGFPFGPHPGGAAHHPAAVHPHHLAGHPGGFAGVHPGFYDTPAFSSAAYRQAHSGERDYNLAGLAIEDGLHLDGIQ